MAVALTYDCLDSSVMLIHLGSRLPSGLDMFVITMLYYKEPSRSVRSYIMGLCMATYGEAHA